MTTIGQWSQHDVAAVASTQRRVLQVVVALSGMKKGGFHAQPADVDLDRIVGYHSDEDSAGERLVIYTDYCCYASIAGIILMNSAISRATAWAEHSSTDNLH